MKGLFNKALLMALVSSIGMSVAMEPTTDTQTAKNVLKSEEKQQIEPNGQASAATRLANAFKASLTFAGEKAKNFMKAAQHPDVLETTFFLLFGTYFVIKMRSVINRQKEEDIALVKVLLDLHEAAIRNQIMNEIRNQQNS